ncbi:unnamed protein product, partial [Staurois parvus]
MQTASTNIGERMGRSQELSGSKRGPVIGGHLGNKSIRDISWLLNIPRSTVSGIITKWKQLGTTATQPPSGRPRHMTGRGGQRMLKRTVRRSRQLSAQSIAAVSLDTADHVVKGRCDWLEIAGVRASEALHHNFKSKMRAPNEM